MAGARRHFFETEGGCTVSITSAPEHLGDGVILSLDMLGENVGSFPIRHVEVYLSRENMGQLRNALTTMPRADGTRDLEF
jgi:hypothetical protein